MKFLRRKVQATETVHEEGRIIHREIQITVEREWLSIPSPGPSEGSMQDPAEAAKVATQALAARTIPKLR